MLDNIIVREKEGDDNDALNNDIHAGMRKNPRYHSLMGHNQHAERNKDTIKMSSASAAVNQYRNV